MKYRGEHKTWYYGSPEETEALFPGIIEDEGPNIHHHGMPGNGYYNHSHGNGRREHTHLFKAYGDDRDEHEWAYEEVKGGTEYAHTNDRHR